MMMTDKPSQPANRPAPALIVLLIVPVLGLLIAAVMLLDNVRQTANPPTPLPVTAPPMPTLPNPNAMVDAEILDFSLPSLNGGTLTLSSFQGRPIFLNFWATWCEPCQRELPAFQQFAQEQAAIPDGAVIIAVNLGETRGAVETYLRSVGVSGILVALDEQVTVADQYGVFNLPVTFIIDRRGVVRQPHFGEMKLDDLAAYLVQIG
jgi:thiol-disulfide isomerase/thioredoxin